MAPVDKKLIARINELAKKKKEGSITQDELAEQAKLRAQYIKLFRAGFEQQLKATKIVDANGNDITPRKLKEKSIKIN